MTGIWLILGLALAAEESEVTASVQLELERASSSLQLEGQPGPHRVFAELLEGEVSTTVAEFGAVTSHDAAPYRMVRVEVRAGDELLDSADFSGSFGVRSGTTSRALSDEQLDIALRRELWLAFDAAYKGATEQYAAKKAARKGREGPFPPLASAVSPEKLAPVGLKEVHERWTEERAQALSGALSNGVFLEEGAAVARDWQGRRLVMSTEGTEAWVRTGHTIVRVEAIGRAQDGARLRDTRSWVARSPEQMADLPTMVAEVRRMAGWVEGLKSAPVEEDYLGPVLFQGQAATEFFRQLLHPEISGTPPKESAVDSTDSDMMSVPSARIGRRLLPAGWSVYDDPTADPTVAGGYTHDHEAVPAQAVHLIKNGVLRDVLMSRVPRKDRAVSTGHGRSLGVDRREAMPANVQVLPPRSRSERGLQRSALRMARQAGLPYVLVVRRMTPPGLAEDFEIAITGEGPLSGLTPPTEVVRLYADGREEPVRGARFVGVDRRTLRDVVAAGRMGASMDVMDATGRTARFDIGAVGGLPATWQVPDVLVAEMELRGSGGGESRILTPPGEAAAP